MINKKLINLYITSGKAKAIDKKDFSNYLSDIIKHESLPAYNLRPQTISGMAIYAVQKAFNNKRAKGLHFLTMFQDEDEKAFKFFYKNLKMFPNHKIKLYVSNNSHLSDAEYFVIHSNLICFHYNHTLILIQF